MAQPNVAAITNHLQGIQNEIALVHNIPTVAGVAALQQQLHANQQQVDAYQQQANANHMQVMALLGQIQRQIG